jgi:hypothetical protein
LITWEPEAIDIKLYGDAAVIRYRAQLRITVKGLPNAPSGRFWHMAAGQSYDPCYHLRCDTYANNNDVALDVNSDAVAKAVLQFAMNTQAVNGQRGKGNFKMPPVQEDGPDGTATR